MRVISGEFGGRILHAPRGSGTRPTSDRVKESLFNILSHRLSWEGIAVCDLFSGTGALGIEAISRGAGTAVFVECDARVVAVLRDNLARLGIGASATVRAQNAEDFVSASADAFDLILADPPYAYTGLPALADTIARRRLLHRHGTFAVEHAARRDPVPGGEWRLVDRRAFGDTAFSIFTHPGDEAA